MVELDRSTLLHAHLTVWSHGHLLTCKRGSRSARRRDQCCSGQSIAGGSRDGVLELRDIDLFLLVSASLLITALLLQLVLCLDLSGEVGGGKGLLLLSRRVVAVSESSILRLSGDASMGSLRYRHAVSGGAHGCGDANGVWVIASAALDFIARRQEGVEALYQIGIAGEKGGDAFNDARSVNTERGVSVMQGKGCRVVSVIQGKGCRVYNVMQGKGRRVHIRSTLEVLHDVQESVINIWMVNELDLDLIEVAEGVL